MSSLSKFIKIYHRLIVTIIMIMVLPLSFALPKYTANLEQTLMVGNKRHLGMVGIVLPVWQSSTKLLYGSGIGLLDSKSAIDGNFGLGARSMVDSAIYGVYGYYDIRKSPLEHIYHQLILGVEYFRESLELRSNVYLPMSKETILSGSSSFKVNTRTSYLYKQNQSIESPTRGYDIEVGGEVPGATMMSMHGAYTILVVIIQNQWME